MRHVIVETCLVMAVEASLQLYMWQWLMLGDMTVKQRAKD